MTKFRANFPIFAPNFSRNSMKLLIVTIALLAVAILLMGFRALFVKGGKFPSGHVHDLPGLKRKKHRKSTNISHK